MIRKNTGVAVLGLAVLVGGSTAAFAGSNDPDRMFPQSVNAETAQRVEVRDSSDRVVLAGTFAAPRADGAKTERHAQLTGESGWGSAEIETSTRNGAPHREMDVSVDALTPSAQYHVFVDGTEIATFTTDAEGEGSVDFDDTPGR